jgi:hypothetical protein
MPRYFTLRQAQELLPVVEAEFRQALHVKRQLDGAASELSGYSKHLLLAGGAVVDQRKFLLLRSRRDALARRLKEMLQAIQERGCQVKDLELGLVDFPTLYRGKEVCLCWRLGEPEIAHWHETDEGYRGRKPIDQDFLNHHRGDAPA